MSREQLIEEWKRLEFEFNGEHLNVRNIDEYSIAALKEEIEVITYAIADLAEEEGE